LNVATSIALLVFQRSDGPAPLTILGALVGPAPVIWSGTAVGLLVAGAPRAPRWAIGIGVFIGGIVGGLLLWVLIALVGCAVSRGECP
jgi:hypothetical protein